MKKTIVIEVCDWCGKDQTRLNKLAIAYQPRNGKNSNDGFELCDSCFLTFGELLKFRMKNKEVDYLADCKL